MLNLSAGIIVICVNLPFLCKMLVYLFSGQIAAVFLEINLLLAIHLFLSFKRNSFVTFLCQSRAYFSRRHL